MVKLHAAPQIFSYPQVRRPITPSNDPKRTSPAACGDFSAVTLTTPED
jgi:hypothetical protein